MSEPTPEDAGELERRLGAPYRLDGSFPSLWAVELVLRPVRRAPALAERVAWVRGYVRALVERAWREMGLALVDLGPDLCGTERPGYVTNLAKAAAQMVSQTPPPEGSALSPVLGMALAPRYGLEAVTLGQPLLRYRDAKHPQVLVAAAQWIEREHLRSVGLGPEAGHVVRALVLPAFGYVASDGAEHVRQVSGALAVDRALGERALLALAGGPDRYVSTIAARAALELGVAPREALAARAMRRARRHFGAVPSSAAVDAAIAAHAPEPRPLEGSEDARLVRARELAQKGDLYGARALLDELVRDRRGPAAAFVARAALARSLGARDLALEDVERAIVVQPYHPRPWIERAALRTGEEAAQDLVRAMGLDPDDDEVRDRLVALHLEGPAAPARPAVVVPVAVPEGAPAPARWAPPRERDQYRLGEVLGEGGMGKVWRVHHRGWGIDLALKIPKRELVERGGIAGFLEEAEAWARLGSHPYTVDCHYVRMQEGVPWLFAELVEGGSLLSWIQSGRLYQPLEGAPEGAARLVDVALMMAYGLAHAHAHDLIHQDMKPANVLVSTRGIAKVTDFGLAKVTQLAALPSHGDGKATMAAGFAGMTPLYCSPEQAAAARGQKVLLTRRTDVWSWGLTVLEMFTAGPTWRSGVLAPHALAAARGARRPPAPPMPVALADLLARCFAPNEADRPRTMDEIAGVLRGIYESLTGEPARPAPPAGVDSAEALNNRAASLLDLGRPDEARAHWRRALAAEPLHLEATYNLALDEWRAGELTDVAALEAVEGARAADGGAAGHWLEAWLHHERAAPAEVARATEAGRVRGAAGIPTPPADTPRGIDERTLAHVAGAPRALAVAADGSAIARLTEEGVLAVHGATAEAPVRARPAPGAAHVAVDPTGRWVATAGAAGVELWELATGTIAPAAIGPVSALAFAATGEVLAAVGDRVLLVGPTGGSRELGRDEGAVRGLAVARAGQLLASAGEDGALRLRRRDGAVARTLRHERAIDWVELSEDGTRALTGSWDAERSHYRLAVWDTASASLVRRLEEPAARRAAFTDAARHVVSWDERGGLRLWRLRDGRCVRTEPAPVEPARVAWAPAADVGARASAARVARIELLAEVPIAPVVLVRPEEDAVVEERAARVARAVAALERALAVGDAREVALSMEALRALPGHRRHPRAAQLARLAAVATRRGPVHGAFPGATRRHLAGPVVALSAREGSEDVLAVSWDEGRGVLEVRGRAFEGADGFEVDLVGSLAAATATADGAVLAAAGDVLYRVSASGTVALADCPGVRDLAVAGPRVLVAGERGVAAWDLAAGAWEPSFAYVDDVTDVSVAGDRVAIAARRGAPSLWSISERRPVRGLAQEPGRRVELGPAGRKAACLLEDEILVVEVDDPADVPLARRVAVAGARVVTFADEDRVLLAGTRTGEVVLVDLEGPGVPLRLGRHANAVRALVATADGRTITSGGRDRTVRRWHVEYARR